MNYSYIIYDGSCGFCNKTIMFIAKIDKKDKFKFVHNFSNFGKELLQENNIKGLEKDTIILVEKNKVFVKSTAVKRIFLETSNYYFLGVLLSIFPEKISNYLYNFISNRRKRIINNSICKIPNGEIRKKFLITLFSIFIYK